MPVLRRPRGPDAAGDAPARRRRGRCASSRTSTRRSSARRSSSTRRGTCARSPSFATRRARPRRGGVAAAAQGGAETATSTRSSTRAARPVASLPHTHSQLAWLPEPSPETRHGIDREAGRIVERDGLVVACPYAGRCPTSASSRPSRPREAAFDDDLLGAGAAAARRRGPAPASRRRRGPLNAWLHDGPDWHLELAAPAASSQGSSSAPGST